MKTHTMCLLQLQVTSGSMVVAHYTSAVIPLFVSAGPTYRHKACAVLHAQCCMLHVTCNTHACTYVYVYLPYTFNKDTYCYGTCFSKKSLDKLLYALVHLSMCRGSQTSCCIAHRHSKLVWCWKQISRRADSGVLSRLHSHVHLTSLQVNDTKQCPDQSHHTRTNNSQPTECRTCTFAHVCLIPKTLNPPICAGGHLQITFQTQSNNCKVVS